MSKENLETFTKSYTETLLWCGVIESRCGDISDEIYYETDLSPDAKETIRLDCENFYESNRGILDLNPEQGGHAFYLTRNRHGAGFWDGSWGSDGRYLTERSKPYGEFHLYTLSDGTLEAA